MNPHKASEEDVRGDTLVLLPSSLYSLFFIGVNILTTLGYRLLGLFFCLLPRTLEKGVQDATQQDWELAHMKFGGN